MKKSEVDSAMLSLWVLVREVSPIVIGSQSLHGKFPDLADTILYSREVDVILPNKAKLGNWLVEVVGPGTPFEADRGYYIDHVVPRDGLPVLASGWEARALREPILFDGGVEGHVSYLSPEDMALSKLAAGRDKDFVFLGQLVEAGYIKIAEIEALIPLIPVPHRDRVLDGMSRLHAILATTDAPVLRIDRDS